ncbi:Gfo/Idh/MocA family protein [Mycolicibacterium vaccae]|uniref:Oxidoreductase domain-containing protein n=1 Tax=Mycolicibacterium vaccae ATCC 25954 TaxID=1194972 RepID=K0V5S2_MYCVA|nr:Gfo/Idh/MocA family oxidoreductase [Mycolicibacterium vaccae]ANI40931.1 oxidoreductase [Mycolicibacterium vaccae 95051]EJZ12895.1 oxidoreductase domain-containing protein [Mycolicibacterium vaccae ATCC 25954]MCV7063000.1 Gfo/Idh/MocA family oxidoreductase [Mycolicibacterium vaccae]
MSLRIGILGASRIAASAIVEPAAALGHRLVAVAARDPLRAQVFADKYGVERVLASYQDVVTDPEVDVVYNPLANALHAPWNLAAVAAGKPVLTEKPFARDRTEAARVAAAADAAGVTVMEGFHYLFHPINQRALALAGDGTLGELTRVEVRMGMPEPQPEDPRWSLDLAGGALMDLGCYGLHALRRFGTPSVVSATAVQRSPGIDERFDAELVFPSGVTGLTANSMVEDEYSFTLRLIGTRGEAFVHDFVKPHGDDRLTVHTEEGTTVEHHGTRTTYTYQLEAFAAHVLDGAPLPLDTADAVANMALIDEAYRAAGMQPR